MMAVKFSMPNMPKLEILKVPPEYSSGTNVPDLARSTRSRVSEAILLEGLFLRILDNGYDQTFVSRYRHADIDTLVGDDGSVM